MSKKISIKWPLMVLLDDVKSKAAVQETSLMGQLFEVEMSEQQASAQSAELMARLFAKQGCVQKLINMFTVSISGRDF